MCFMKQILIVDDNKMNLAAAKNALSDLYRIAAVLSGGQALKFLENNQPDLILLDINMPEMDGFAVLEELQKREQCRHIPVIFLTADNDAATEAHCLKLGALDFIAKPFVPEVMRSRIGRILELEELRKNLAERLDRKIKEVSDMKNKSYTDALTGLWNRAYTEETVGAMLQNNSGGYLFMMDMDNFKAINDIYGHIAGDRTLQAFAGALKRQAGPKDVVCRIGGDEFMIFFAGEFTKDDMCSRAAAIISDMGAFLQESRFETNSSVSVGIAQAFVDAEDFTSLYNAADKALYYVKQNGKNAYHFFSDHSAVQAKRSSRFADLHTLHSLLSRTDAGKGAYITEFDSLHHVYNFIRRLVERKNCPVHTLLFTAAAPDHTAAEEAMDLLEQAVKNAMRCVDVAARYSAAQLMVVLPDTDREQADTAAARILALFRENYHGAVEFSFEIRRMEGKQAAIK